MEQSTTSLCAESRAALASVYASAIEYLAKRKSISEEQYENIRKAADILREVRKELEEK